MTVALVTDSNSQLPASLVDRYAVRVAPLSVVLDGVDHLEGVDLDAATFYARLAEGATVSTAAPSPGRVLQAYHAAADAGASEVLSIHIGSSVSATVDAVHVAASMSPIPVTVVDTGTASFAVGCCVWAAVDRLAAGGSIADAEAEARRVAGAIGNVFVVGALRLATGGGRLAAGVSDAASIPVLALEAGAMRPVTHVSDVEAAIAAMTEYVAAWPAPGRLHVGVGDALAPDLARDLTAALSGLDRVASVVGYEIGPSVGAHTGAGTIGAVFYPVGSEPAT